jgi:dienelactone hydrolase
MFRKLSLVCITLLFLSSTPAKVVLKEVDYKAGDTDMKGYLAYDDEASGNKPGILVIHEWWGNDDYAKFRAQELAKLGYIAFAGDMYGGAKTTNDPKQAGEWAGQIKKNPKLARERLEGALSTLKQQPNVDPEKLGAIGYCFGGTCVLQMARWNMPVKAVVSFHGDLTPIEPASGRTNLRILVCTGEADSFVPPPAIDAFKKETAAAGADVKIMSYPNAHHSFTNPNADSHHIDNIKYDADADKKSWEDMKSFFADVFK